MIDKQQLQAMGEHQAEQHMCMAKQIEDLQAHLQECANGAAKMQEQRDAAYVMAGKSGLERDKFAQQLKAANQQIAAMAELLRDSCDINKALGFLIDLSENDGKEDALSILSEHLDKCESLLSSELYDHFAGVGNMVPDGWKLVPIELTRAMREAFHDAHEECESGDNWCLDCPDHQWSAMLAAAPKPEQTK
jgi:hypothetical protein